MLRLRRRTSTALSMRLICLRRSLLAASFPYSASSSAYAIRQEIEHERHPYAGAPYAGSPAANFGIDGDTFKQRIHGRALHFPYHERGVTSLRLGGDGKPFKQPIACDHLDGRLAAEWAGGRRALSRPLLLT